MLNLDRQKAVNLFLRLCQGTDDALFGTRHVEQFIRYATFDHYDSLRGTLLAMLRMEGTDARAAAARQITLSAFHNTSAEKDAASVLSGDEVARNAAAEVYARNLGSKSVQGVCRKRLIELFNDPSKKVRDAAADCFRWLDEQHLASENELIAEFINSEALSDNSHDLTLALEKCSTLLPEVICAMPERLIARHRASGAGPLAIASRWVHDLPALVVRLYEQTRDPQVKTRCLNIIDDLLELGSTEIDTQLTRVER